MQSRARALIVHPSPNAVAEIRDVLSPIVTADAAHTEAEAIRRLSSAEYAVVIIDHKPRLDAGRIIAEAAAAQPDSVMVVMTSEPNEGRDLDAAMPGKVFRFLAG